jgi:hypothetical protein
LISLIALFAALGGGYAVAFSGSGTLQKAAVEGLDANFEDARTLNGFGTLQARCDSGVAYRLDNTTSKEIAIREFNEVTGEEDNDFVEGGTQSDEFESDSLNGSQRFHLSKTETGNKAQVDIAVSNNGPYAIVPCSETQVRVLALNTQE